VTERLAGGERRTARRCWRVFGAAILCVAGTACVRFGTLPSLEFYALVIPRADDDTPAVTRGAVLDGTLAIVPYDAPGIYGDGGIVFRIDDTQLHAYPSRQWAQPLGDMLGMATETVLASRSLTASAPIFDPPSARSSAYIWQGRVREFEEVDRGTRVFAAVALDARIVRTAGDTVVWAGSARAERPVDEPTMPAIVRTLSELTVDVIGELADSARAALQAPTTAMPAPPPARAVVRPPR
jgi:ABC-type uncharacterized transport system auxiliary subunit